MKQVLFISLLLLNVVVSHSQELMQCNQSHCQQMKRMLRGGGAATDPGNLRSDTLDVLSNIIRLDMTMMDSQQISASCEVYFKSKMDGIDWINLDLLALTVDSVTDAGGQLVFTHLGELLHVQLPQVLSENDEYNIIVHYHGSPENDVLWGGFYFGSGYAYNLGVGFVANPHNYGRVWFPCFDNFVERSSFNVNVLTNNNRTVYCGGIRTSVDVVGQDSLLTNWSLTEEIPSYLASVAVAPYTHAESVYESITGDVIPVYLTAKAVDTTEMKQSMINLHNWLVGAEEHYGPYRWSRVGFTAVPFNGGAMEHATNIAYPLFAIDGTLAYEELYAHELAHHWWGDLITCRNAYDMWLNEGWASYSEALFNEVIYGHDAYIEYVKENHKDVLLHAHEDDGARYPVSPVPHELTYGAHVYSKGADVAHTLRKQMGSDENFWNAITEFMEEYQYSDVSTEDMFVFFQNYTENDLTSFFQHAVQQPGFAEFRVKDFSVGDVTTFVEIEQHLHYAPEYYDNVLMNVTAINQQGEKFTTENVTLAAEGEMTVSLQLPIAFEPIAIYLNNDEGVNMAVLAEERWLHETGADDYDYAEMDLEVVSLGELDSVFVRVENHFAAVDENQSQAEYFISPDRWWNVITNATEDASIDAEIRYYGNEAQSNYFDSLFFDYLQQQSLTEDSLLLLYRQDGVSSWGLCPSYELSVMGVNDNWSGRFTIHNLKQGQYAWAVATGVDGIIYPDVQNEITIGQTLNSITIRAEHQTGQVHIYDGAGRLIHNAVLQSQLEVNTVPWPKGVYQVRCTFQYGTVASKSVVLR